MKLWGKKDQMLVELDFQGSSGKHYNVTDDVLAALPVCSKRIHKYTYMFAVGWTSHKNFPPLFVTRKELFCPQVYSYVNVNVTVNVNLCLHIRGEQTAAGNSLRTSVVIVFFQLPKKHRIRMLYAPRFLCMWYSSQLRKCFGIYFRALCD